MQAKLVAVALLFLCKYFNMKNFLGLSTTAIHSANNKNNEQSHLVPVYASSTFYFDSADEGMEKFANENKSNVYSRWGNPTFKAVEETIEALESFQLKDENNNQLTLKALLHSSGQAASSTLFFSNLKSGDTILSHQALYGGTQESMQKNLFNAGIRCILIDFNDVGIIEKTIQENTSIKLIHIETPCNPTLTCFDIEAITKIAHSYHIKVSVDNTICTPYLQQPFKYGVDFVMHSTTKFLNGHGNAIGGILLGRDIEFMKTIAWKWHVLLGGNSNPFDAFLLHQGLKTLEIRMQAHCLNANLVANFLNEHSSVQYVNYTGLSTHKQNKLATTQMKNHPPLISFELKGGFEAAKKFIDKLKICVRAVSLGTVDTLVSHPASMSHFGIPKEVRIATGITDGLIRMSVGIENFEDLKMDLMQALD